MAEIAVSVRSLSKRYRRHAGMGLDLFRRHTGAADWFSALRDISFDVERGTGVGIIGGNGAGKSTLLKVLARIVPPTEGEAEIRGRINSLLEVGTGFQPDLSGRANIYLNASILGMSHAETDDVFEDIVAFSGIGEFIDMPVKHYSSGMYSRLAFSVAANVTGDILLVDEVLAVGDAEFQRKCLKRMDGLLNDERRTVLFVSHSMDAVMRFCSHALWLDHGECRAFGASEDVVSDYLRSVNRLGGKYVAKRGVGNGAEHVGADIAAIKGDGLSSVNSAKGAVPESDNRMERREVRVISTEQTAGFKPAATILAVVLQDGDGRPTDIISREDQAAISIDCEMISSTYRIHAVVHLHCAPRAGVPEDTHVFTCVREPPLPNERGHYRVTANIPGNLLTTGLYSVSVALVTRARPIIRHCKLERVLHFQVIDKSEKEESFLAEQLYGVIQPNLEWTVTTLDESEARA